MIYICIATVISFIITIPQFFAFTWDNDGKVKLTDFFALGIGLSIHRISELIRFVLPPVILITLSTIVAIKVSFIWDVRFKGSFSSYVHFLQIIFDPISFLHFPLINCIFILIVRYKNRVQLVQKANHGPFLYYVRVFWIFLIRTFQYKLFENENEQQKTKPVPILIPMASRNFPNVKARKKIYNWTSKIIPFIHLGKEMDRSQIFFKIAKIAFREKRLTAINF